MSHHRIYVGPFDAVEVLGTVVGHGEQIEVTAEEAAALDKQPSNWARPTTNRAKAAAADPSPAPPTPPLQPPPIGEEDQQPQATPAASAPQQAPQAPQEDVVQQPAPETPQTPTPAPGEGSDETQEAGQ